MSQNTTADERSTSVKVKMAEHFDEERSEYEDSDGYTIVYEDDDCTIVSDHTGHEINEWAALVSDTRETLRSTFRAIADEKMGEKDAHEGFSHSDPVVFDKFEA